MSAFLDNFSGAAATLSGRSFSDGSGTTWSLILGTALATNGSGQAIIPINSGDNTGKPSAQTATDTVYGEFDFDGVSGPNPGDPWFIWVDCGSNAAGNSGYEFGLGGDGSIAAYRINGGAYTPIATGTWTPGAALIRIERILATNTINCYIGGVLVLSVVDSNEPTGSGNRYSGMGGYTGAQVQVNFGEFRFGDISAANDAVYESPMQHGGLRQVMAQ